MTTHAAPTIHSTIEPVERAGRGPSSGPARCGSSPGPEITPERYSPGSPRSEDDEEQDDEAHAGEHRSHLRVRLLSREALVHEGDIRSRRCETDTRATSVREQR